METNRHTRALLRPMDRGTPFAELLASFDANHGALEMAHAGGTHRLNFMTCAELPLTIVCAFTAIEGGVLVVGGSDPQEQEALRRELMKSNQSLGTRTRELQRANAALERSNALKTRFVGMAAHDLRSPILAVKAVAEALEQSIPSIAPDLSEDVRMLSKSASFMGRIVDDFLDVALIDAGQLELRLEKASLREVIAEALRVAQARARCKSVPIAFAPGPDAEMECDASRLQQVLMNLLNNAVDHSPPGAPVTVALESQEECHLIHVRDQGHGVAPEVRDNLFGAFVHANDKTRGERSIGLGLAISRRIVEAHRGQLLLDSSPAGSTFTVSLPLQR